MTTAQAQYSGPPLWNAPAETLSGPELEALQLEKLKSLLVRVYENSPYYREAFDAAGVNPYEFASLKEYERYPVFTKYDERASQARSLAEDGHPLGKHITCDIRKVNRMSASSGTTGTPSFQGHTRSDRRIQAENMARLMKRIGIEPGDRALYAGVMSMWVAGIPTIDCMMEYGLNVIPIGALVGSIKVAEMALLTNPRVITGTPSFLRHMLKKAAEAGLNLTTCGIEKVLVYGEPGGSQPAIIAELSNGFGGAEVYDLMGGTGCLNPIFTSCEAHDGFHFFSPDYAYIEVRDPETGKFIPIADGADGELIYTGLDRECGPLVRFSDGDRVQITTKPCSCGRPGWRMRIMGRVDDMLLLKGVNVFPSAVQDVALQFKPQLTGNIRILKYSESPVIEPPMKIWVECAGNPSQDEMDALAQKLSSEIQRRLRFNSVITPFAEGQMEMEHGATGKAKLIKKMFGEDTK